MTDAESSFARWALENDARLLVFGDDWYERARAASPDARARMLGAARAMAEQMTQEKGRPYVVDARGLTEPAAAETFDGLGWADLGPAPAIVEFNKTTPSVLDPIPPDPFFDGLKEALSKPLCGVCGKTVDSTRPDTDDPGIVWNQPCNHAQERI